jgi:hypothetical protein
VSTEKKEGMAAGPFKTEKEGSGGRPIQDRTVE